MKFLGEINIDQLKEFTNIGQAKFNPNSDILAKIKPLINKRGIVLIMGTWCEDSREKYQVLLRFWNL